MPVSGSESTRLAAFEFSIYFDSRVPFQRRYRKKDPKHYDESAWSEEISQPATAEEALIHRKEDFRKDLEWEMRARLELLYGSIVYPRVTRMDRGSITGSLVILLAAGYSAFDFLSKYKGFYESLELLREQMTPVITNLSEKYLSEELNNPPNVMAQVDIFQTYQKQIEGKKVEKNKPTPPLTRSIIRWLVAIGVVLFILMQFQTFRIQIGSVWPIPDVNRQVFYIYDSSQSMNTRQALFRVWNEGTGPARNLLVRVKIPGAVILGHNFQSEELYEIKTEMLQDASMEIWLNRLAAGTKLDIYLQTDSILSDERIQFSAVSDEGSSIVHDSLVFSGNPDDLDPWTTTSWGRTLYKFLQSTKAEDSIQWIIDSLFPDRVSLRSFLIFLSLVIVFSGLLWLFFTSKHGLMAFAVGAWLVIWIFFSYQISSLWMVAALLYCAILVGMDWVDPDDLLDYIKRIRDSRKRTEAIFELGCITIPLLVLFGFLFWVFRKETISLHWVTGLFLLVFLYEIRKSKPLGRKRRS